MKKFTLGIILSMILVFSVSVKGQLVLYEDFNYTPPAFIGGNTGSTGSNSNNWTTHSVTSGQTTTIDVIAGNLSYPGLQASGGYKVSMFGAANTMSRDINRAITYAGTTAYFSVLLNVVDNAGLTVNGDYFMHFGATAGSSVSIFGGRLGAKSVNSGANYRYMIQNTSGGTPTFTEFPQDMTFGTTYLVVVKLDRSTTPITATLWVNPAPIGGAEPAGGVVNASGTGAFANFMSICFRNNGSTPKLEIDEVRVGATYADVTPMGVVTPATQAQNITFGAITATSMNVSWTNGSGANRIVKINTTNSFTNPVDGTTPAANPVYSGSGEQVIYNGSSNSVSVSGLTANTNYWFRVYEYNGTGSGTMYLTTTATNNPNSQLTTAWIPPAVNTVSVTNVAYTTLTANGEVLSDGGYPVTARGFCYATSPNPTISGPHTTETGTLGAFFSNITGLTPGTTYYVRAYASNANVTGYGADLTITTLALGSPVVITAPATTITHNTAVSGGNVTSDGGLAITARGVCYGTTPNPVITGPHTTEPGTTGTFTSTLTGLTPQTTYYTRAYATNSMGTSYGATVSFTTLCEPLAPLTNFYASATQINVGDTINFFDSTLYCPVSWNWSFVGGEPMTSTAQNPAGIVFNYPGTFHVCLTTTNAYGTTTKCKMDYIVVTGPPVPANVNLVISEIMYNSPEAGADSLEFIELYNHGTTVASLQDFVISEGIELTFPAVTVNPGEYLVVAKNSAAMLSTFGISNTIQWTSGSLSNSGELIRIKDYNGFTVDSVVYNDVLPWDTLANGYGYSLEFCQPDSNNALPENWRHAAEFAATNATGDSIWASPGTGCKYPPLADFSADQTQITMGMSVNFTDLSTGTISTWEWTFEGGSPATSAQQTPPPVLYPTFGTYSVSLKVTNPDGSNTRVREDYIEVGTVGISTLNSGTSPVVYPNPASDRFTVIYPGTDFTATMYSVTGNKIMEMASEAGKAEFKAIVVPKGIYIIKIKTTDNQTFSKKVTIK